MSIHFPTDQPRRRKGGGGFIFLLIFGAIAFMVFRGMSAGPQPDNQPNRPNSGSNRPMVEDDRYRIDPNFGKDQTDSPARTNPSDWGQEDGPTQRNAAPASTATQRTVKKKSTDWGQEDGPVQKNSSSSNNGFQFSDGTDSTAPANKTNSKATKGDWTAEEVETN
jgi:hypothetical protein